jgi:hypothetical protein
MALHRRPAAALLLAVLLAGCGSTAASRSTVTSFGAPGGDPSALQGQTFTATSAAPGSTANGYRGTGPAAGGSAGRGASALGTPTQVPAVDGGPGAVRNAAPIKIGIVLTATSNAASFGITFGNTYTERQVDDALVAAMNAKGGLDGRRIIPVYAKTDTGSANWETDFAAACATLTQDNHVEAVLGYVFNYFASFESCLAKKGIPHLNTGFNIPDAQELRQFPLHVALDVPTIGRRSLAKLEGGVADGVLTSKSKIGVLRDTCPGTARSYEQTFLPTAKRLGLTISKDISISCANGNSDSGSAVEALQSAVLQFASSGVDRVLFPAVSEGPALLLFELSAESQHYYPTYVVSSLANLEALRTDMPANQIKNVHGYGWMPTQDVPPSTYPRRNGSQARCLSLLRTKGVTPSAGPDYYYAYNLCEAFFVYELALTRTGGNSEGRGIVAAVKSIGAGFDSATNAGGSLFSPAFPDAPRFARHTVYVASCTCFGYTGPSRPIPTS